MQRESSEQGSATGGSPDPPVTRPQPGWAWAWRQGGALALSWHPESRAGRCSRHYLKREGSGAPGSRASPLPEIQGLFLLVE